jgi:alpha-glucosidase
VESGSSGCRVKSSDAEKRQEEEEMIRRFSRQGICTAIFLALFIGAGLGATAASELGAVLSWEKTADGVVFECEGGKVKISAHGDKIIRVRAVGAGENFGPDESFAVIDSAPLASAPGVKETAKGIELKTRSLKIKIDKTRFKLAFYDKNSDLINEDGDGIYFEENGLVWCGKVMPADEHYYGFGEKTGPLDKRGRRMEMWNSDAMYSGERDPLYQSHPFFVGLRKGVAYGIFFDNTYHSCFDVGSTDPDSYTFSADGGQMNYYFIFGPELKSVIKRYTSLTGRMPLPPLWSIGYQQCRYSYKDEARLRWLARNFRKRRIPCDVIYMDIHYMDDWKVFTFHPKRFPDPKGLLSDLAEQGFKVVTIIDPGIKVEKGYAPYDEGMAKGYFCLRPDSTPFMARVWPGDCHWPDFTRPEVREWWGRLHKSHVEYGVAGIWNDMNEPAMWLKDIRAFDLMSPLGTPDMNQMLFGTAEDPVPHARIHNVYGLLECQATYEGLLKLRPNQRPFIVSRAGYPGIWRYSSVWTGDNYSNWPALAMCLPMHLNMGISGITFAGSDIGGFILSPTPERFARWIQQGVFYPFCRTHTAIYMPRQEPWSFGPRVERISRDAIDLRYRLLPYTYSLFEESTRDGVPVMRAMVVEFPDDEATYGLEDQFMWGTLILVAPVVEKGARERSVYFPEGRWFRLDDDSVEQGPGRAEVSAELDELPVYVREGAIVPLAPVMNYIGEREWDPLTLEVYPGSEPSFFELYEDDGESLDYRAGKFARTMYSCRKNMQGIELSIGSRQGAYPVPERALVLRFHGLEKRPEAVTVTGRDRKPRELAEFSFNEETGILEIQLRDRGEAQVVRVEIVR